MKLVTCKTCGWVHSPMSRKNVLEAIVSFNDFFFSLSKQEQRELYGGKGVTMSHYTKCFYCSGPYTNFRPWQTGDCPDGCTIQTILSGPKRKKKCSCKADPYHCGVHGLAIEIGGMK